MSREKIDFFASVLPVFSQDFIPFYSLDMLSKQVSDKEEADRRD